MLCIALTGRAVGAPLPYTVEAFRAAQASDSRILVYAAASWCPTCSLQQAALAETLTDIENSGELGDLKVFIVDFDSQKDAVKALAIRVQSTLIAFHGQIETGRSIGETNGAAIKAFLVQSANREAEISQRAALVLSSASLALSFLAGILSNLSPCVLPLLPIVLGSAAAAHRFGIFALATGVVLSYVTAGMLIATLGFGLGNDGLRFGAAIVMTLFGLLLMSTVFQERLALAGSPLENAANRLIGLLPPSRLEGQFVIGALLGAVWTPCIGPTLAAAITLATKREALSQVGLTMLLFGLGAALPLIVIGTVSRAAFMRWEQRLDRVSRIGEIVLGAFLVLLGGAVLTGIDREAETLLLQLSPEWLSRITLRF
jgi:cytochrome c biogenesis protein CcdA